MQLVRDLLDKAVVDRNGRDMGRVDRVVLEVRGGAPARVVAIEVGPTALAERTWRPSARWILRLLHALGAADGQPLRVPVAGILGVTDAVKVDLAFGETPAAAVERALRRVVRLVPGARR